MPNPFSRASIPSAVSGKHFHDLSCDHITSQDFFQFQPVLMQPVIPGQSVDVTFNMFSRLATLVKPTYANIKIVNRAFFVPYRMVYSNWNRFITDTVSGSTIPKLNYVWESDLCLAVIGAMTEGTAFDLDVSYKDEDGVIHSVKHTKKSKLFLKILNSLGYKLSLGSDFSNDGIQSWDEKLSVLPLLAALKIYCDWFVNTQYADLASEFLDYKLHATNQRLNVEDISRILDFICTINYDADFFVSAWDRPQAPNDATMYTPVNIVDPSLPMQTSSNKSAVITGGTEGTAYVHSASSGSAVANFTTTIDHLLHAVTSYLRRHQLAGIRDIDRYLSRFGIELHDNQSNRCSYIGKQEVPVSIGDVYSTADTEGASLGDYSAKGLAYAKEGKEGHFHYKSDEFGVIIVISTVVARTMYYQGLHPEVLRLDHLQYYTPEFDGVGPMAIKSKLLANDRSVWVANIPQLNEKVFGFLPQYSDYAYNGDNITGDFCVDTLRTDLDKFYVTRKFISGLQHSQSFVKADNRPFDKMFNEENEFYDHFFSIFHFQIRSQSPKKSVFDTFDFELDEKGRPVPVNVGGTRL